VSYGNNNENLNGRKCIQQEKIIADKRNQLTGKENYCRGLDCSGGVVGYCEESWSLKEDIRTLEDFKCGYGDKCRR